MKTGLTNNGLCKTDRRHSSLRWGGSILVLGLLAASHAQAQSPFVQYQTAPTPAAPAPAAPGPAAPAAPLSNLSLSNVKDGITTGAPGAPPAPAASLLDITPADATPTETADRPSPPAEASPAAPPAQPPAGVASVTPAAPTQSIPSTSLPPINVTAPSAPPQPAPVTVGLDSPTVVDTATLKTADKVIGLYGIVGIKGEASQGLQSYLSAPADSHLTCQSQTGPEFVCLTPDGTDVAEVSLLNGAARAKEDAPLAYHEQEASAQAARRGIWSSLPPPPVVLQHPQIVDTATLVMGGQTYLLDGIDGVGAPYAPVMQSYIANAGDSLSCEAEANPGHFICVLPDGTDIAKVALVNGAARVTPDAPDSYRIQQLDAINNHRGMWVTPPPPDMMATLVVTDPADCCVLVAGDDGFDGITYVGGEPTAIIDGSTVFLTYAGDAGWGYYDGGHQWHDAPAAYSDHLNHFHPDAHGLRGYRDGVIAHSDPGHGGFYRGQPVRPMAGRGEPGRAGPGRMEAGRPMPGRAEAGRPMPGHAEAGRPMPGRVEPGRPGGGPAGARPGMAPGHQMAMNNAGAHPAQGGFVRPAPAANGFHPAAAAPHPSAPAPHAAAPAPRHK